MQTIFPVYVIGDIHGQFRQLVRILQHANLIGHQHEWTGGQARLCFIGDLVDRGPDGIAVIDLVMQLQTEAAAVGGQVNCVIGNHEVLLLGAYRFGRRSTGLSSNFITKWRQNGGRREELAKLTKAHLEWLAQLPAIVRVGSVLLIHADSTFYTRYGHSETEVNETFRNLLKRSDALAWEELIEAFAMRGVFNHKLGGEEFVERFLTIFGGTQIVHGHTPISLVINSKANKVTSALIYARDRCINVDGGMYLGGPGFLHQLSDSAPTSQNPPDLTIDKSQNI